MNKELLGQRRITVEFETIVHEMNGRNVCFSMMQDTNYRYTPMYEPDVWQVMTRFIQSGDTVVDAGANWGYHTCLMRSLVGDTGKVYAIEPDPSAGKMLHRNIELNNNSGIAKNIWVSDAPLWDAIEERDFYCLPDDGSSSLIVPGTCERALIVRKTTATLDHLFNGSIKLLKLDCEGAEERILRGASQLLEQNKIETILLEINYRTMMRFGWSINSLREYMAQYGFQFYLLSLNGFFPIHIPRDVTLNVTGVILNAMLTRPETLAANWPVANITNANPIYLANYAIKDGELKSSVQIKTV